MATAAGFSFLFPVLLILIFGGWLAGWLAVWMDGWYGVYVASFFKTHILQQKVSSVAQSHFSCAQKAMTKK
jgi:hypothetical protein